MDRHLSFSQVRIANMDRAFSRMMAATRDSPSSIAEELDPLPFECQQCEFSCKARPDAYHHLYYVHQWKHEKIQEHLYCVSKFIHRCYVCRAIFDDRKSCIKHLGEVRALHQHETLDGEEHQEAYPARFRSGCPAPGCSECCPDNVVRAIHFAEAHQDLVVGGHAQVVDRLFNTQQEFRQFFACEIQGQHGFRYVVRDTSLKQEQRRIVKYKCANVIVRKSESKGIRRIKSKKVTSECPAYFRVEIFIDGAVRVTGAVAHYLCDGSARQTLRDNVTNARIINQGSNTSEVENPNQDKQLPTLDDTIENDLVIVDNEVEVTDSYMESTVAKLESNGKVQQGCTIDPFKPVDLPANFKNLLEIMKPAPKRTNVHNRAQNSKKKGSKQKELVSSPAPIPAVPIPSKISSIIPSAAHYVPTFVPVCCDSFTSIASVPDFVPPALPSSVALFIAKPRLESYTVSSTYQSGEERAIAGQLQSKPLIFGQEWPDATACYIKSSLDVAVTNKENLARNSPSNASHGKDAESALPGRVVKMSSNETLPKTSTNPTASPTVIYYEKIRALDEELSQIRREIGENAQVIGNLRTEEIEKRMKVLNEALEELTRIRRQIKI